MNRREENELETNNLEIQVEKLELQLATLTAERDAALARFRENADMKHFVELWEQDQIDYGTAIERAEKAEKELNQSRINEGELDLAFESSVYQAKRKIAILTAERDAALARERELVLAIQALWNGPNDIGTNLYLLIKKIAIGRCYDADGNWQGKVEG